jgi:hypothetical protein
MPSRKQMEQTYAMSTLLDHSLPVWISLKVENRSTLAKPVIVRAAYGFHYKSKSN